MTPSRSGDAGPEPGADRSITDNESEQYRARQLFSYLTSPEWQEYRRILSVFAGTFFTDFTAEDTSAHPALAAAGIDPDVVANRLESLCRWGNLTRSSSVGTPTSLDDYYRRSNRYLITRAGQEVYELSEGILTTVDEIGDVQAGRLRDLHRSLNEIVQQLGAGIEADELTDRVRHIFDLHERFTSELTQFFAELNQWQSRYDLDAQEVQLFATVLVGYVSEKLVEIERMARPIARSVNDVLEVVDELVSRLQSGLAGRIDDAGLTDSTRVRRLKGTDPRDWEHLAGWFQPPSGRPSRLDQLTRQAVAAVRTLTANVTRLSRVGLGSASRRADFVKLASFFNKAPSGDHAHRIASAAFGLGSCRSIGGLSVDVDDPVATTTSYRDAPRAEVAVTMRLRGEKRQRGAVSPLRDRSAEQEQIKQRRQRERVNRASVAAELLLCSDDFGNLDGAFLPGDSFALLRELLNRSWHGSPPGAPVRSVTSDGIRCEVRRTEGSCTVVECSEGRLTLHGLEITVASALGTTGLDRRPAHTKGRM